MRLSIVALAVLAGCAARQAPTLSVPAAETGRVSAVARSAPRTGGVLPIAVAVTNGRAGPLHLDARQIYALTDAGERVAPLPPGEAARQAGGKRLPGAVKAGATGAASGGVLGAVAGAISGAIQGGIGSAVAVGAAVGTALGAITGVISGGRESAPDIAGFTDRALPSTTLGTGLSASGYLYYPAGTYRALEILATDDPSQGPVPVRVSIEPEQ